MYKEDLLVVGKLKLNNIVVRFMIRNLA